MSIFEGFSVLPMRVSHIGMELYEGVEMYSYTAQPVNLDEAEAMGFPQGKRLGVQKFTFASQVPIPELGLGDLVTPDLSHFTPPTAFADVIDLVKRTVMEIFGENVQFTDLTEVDPDSFAELLEKLRATNPHVTVDEMQRMKHPVFGDDEPPGWAAGMSDAEEPEPEYLEGDGDSLMLTVPLRILCGPTGDEMFCACGCGGDDSRCDPWHYRYKMGLQVDPAHVCCNIQGREYT